MMCVHTRAHRLDLKRPLPDDGDDGNRPMPFTISHRHMMQGYHILHISYKDHVTNEEVHAKIQQAIGTHDDLLTIVKRLKLQWYGHVSRSSGLVNTILQGTMKGGRRQGRERKRWEDNIREWTGLEFAKSQRALGQRENWRKLVVKSFVVPKRPPRLKECECEGEGEDEIRRAGKKSCTCLKQISRNNMD